MDKSTVERQQVLEAVNNLPEEALLELANFLDYLRYKLVQCREANNQPASFLVAVTGLGDSGQQEQVSRWATQAKAIRGDS